MYIECININKNIYEYYQLYKTVNEKNSNNINMLVLHYYYICCGGPILIPDNKRRFNSVLFYLL